MRFLILAAVIWLANPANANMCKDQTPCELGDRSYHVREPQDWDRETPLPVMLHFHGWGRQGTLIVKHGRISGATAPRNVLLLAPNGLGKTWDFWSPGSRDTQFAEDVLKDAAKRYPIDPNNVIVSGYSYGSAMAWRFACETSINVRALLAISGTLSQTEACDSTPTEIRHVHGLRDTVLDFPFGPDGDETYPVKLWRDALECELRPIESEYQTTTKDIFHRRTWSGCNDDASVTLDVHPRGHFIPKGWFAKQLDELLATQN